MSYKQLSIPIAVVLVLLLAACGPAETPTPITIVETVEVTVAPEETPLAIPFLEQWQGSEHADAGAPAFRHWDGEDPPEVPIECARCHSEDGFMDYLGADGSDPQSVDAAPEAGSVITCVACHNESALALSTVELASGQRLDGLDAQARCLQCHQSLTSRQNVDELIEAADVGEDKVSDKLEFVEVHAGAGTAILFGADAAIGYEFEGLQYDTQFMHVEGYQSCQDCHDPHTLNLKLSECAECHEGVAAVNDLHLIRGVGSQIDYDGDDNLEEGIYDEIQGLKSKLAAALRAYALQSSDTSLGYQPSRSPYFFVDTNADGEISLQEAQAENQFQAWTPRLLKAAYNYHLVQSDPGAYAHGGKYAIQLIWDSIESLNKALDEPIELVSGRRIDAAHFAGSTPAFRNWDQSAQVPADCSQCHSASGLTTLIQKGELSPQSPSNGLSCSTCHESLFESQALRVVPISFASDAIDPSIEDSTSLCVGCHQADETGFNLQDTLADRPPEQISRSLAIIDPHPLPVGDLLFGSESNAGYEYADKAYRGRFNHAGASNTCTSCHDAHTFKIEVERCDRCHSPKTTLTDPRSIRTSLVDYDGDGDAEEGLADEIATQLSLLYTTLRAYAADELEAPILYAGDHPPYFYNDTNANDTLEQDEIVRSNQFDTWNPRLLGAAYNYHLISQDDGGYAHNGRYLLQLLYDSIENLGGEVTGTIRP